MENYRVIQRLGVGTFGSCVKAINNRSQQIVAIKTLRSDNTDESKNQEIQILKKFDNINVIKMVEVIRENRKVSIVMEYIEKDLLGLYDQVKKQGRSFPEQQIKSIIYQVCCGLNYMHELGYFHRDIKPENIMIGENGVVKLIDLGQAKSIQNNIADHTEYVSTRWYRAPEQLIGSGYNEQIDTWALGCVMSELFLLKPLLPGTSDIDQLSKIQAFFGTLQEHWLQGWKLMQNRGVYQPTGLVNDIQSQNEDLKNLYQGIPENALDLLTKILQINPLKRISMPEILLHPWFSNKNQFLPKVLQEEQSDDKYIIEQSPLLVEIKKKSSEHTEVQKQYYRAPVQLILPNISNKRSKSKQNEELSITIQKPKCESTHKISAFDDDDVINCDYVPSQVNNHITLKRNGRRIFNNDSSPPQLSISQKISQELQHNTVDVMNQKPQLQNPIKVNQNWSKVSIKIQKESFQLYEGQQPIKSIFFSKPLQMKQRQ